MKKFEYTLLLDDIVIESGQLYESDQEIAEWEIENNIMPELHCNRYVIKEA